MLVLPLKLTLMFAVCVSDCTLKTSLELNGSNAPVADGYMKNVVMNV